MAKGFSKEYSAKKTKSEIPSTPVRTGNKTIKKIGADIGLKGK